MSDSEEEWDERAEQEEEEEDAPVNLEELDESDIDNEDGDMIPEQKVTINNEAALTRIQQDIALKGLPWIETMDITLPQPLDIKDVHDDLQRELAFYQQGLFAAQEARKRVKATGVEFSRPDDYFAEMVKSDEHMEKIRQKLIDESASIKASEEAKKQRELKKFGKKVQVEKLQERQAQKKEQLEKIKMLKRKRKGADEVSFEDNFDIELEEDDEPSKKKGGKQKGGKGGKPRAGGAKNIKRQKKNPIAATLKQLDQVVPRKSLIRHCYAGQVDADHAGCFETTIQMRCKDVDAACNKAGMAEHGRYLYISAQEDQHSWTPMSGIVELVPPDGISVIVLLGGIASSDSKCIHELTSVLTTWHTLKASIHYVIGEATQDAVSVLSHLQQHNFPLGSLHLATQREPRNQVHAFEQHFGKAIKQLLNDFPVRRFVLVTDVSLSPTILALLSPPQVLTVFCISEPPSPTADTITWSRRSSGTSLSLTPVLTRSSTPLSTSSTSNDSLSSLRRLTSKLKSPRKSTSTLYLSVEKRVSNYNPHVSANCENNGLKNDRRTDHVINSFVLLMMNEDEISFRLGDAIIVLEKDEIYGDGWWQIGLFPMNYTSRIPPAGRKIEPESDDIEGSRPIELPAPRRGSTQISENHAASLSAEPGSHRLMKTPSPGTSLENKIDHLHYAITQMSIPPEPRDLASPPLDQTFLGQDEARSASASKTSSKREPFDPSAVPLPPTPTDGRRGQNEAQKHEVEEEPHPMDSRRNIALGAALIDPMLSLPANPEDWEVEQVAMWLESVGLGNVADNFIRNEISGDILLELTPDMLKELEITSFGKRFKVINAITALKDRTNHNTNTAAEFDHPPREPVSTYTPPSGSTTTPRRSSVTPRPSLDLTRRAQQQGLVPITAQDIGGSSIDAQGEYHVRSLSRASVQDRRTAAMSPTFSNRSRSGRNSTDPRGMPIEARNLNARPSFEMPRKAPAPPSSLGSDDVGEGMIPIQLSSSPIPGLPGDLQPSPGSPSLQAAKLSPPPGPHLIRPPQPADATLATTAITFREKDRSRQPFNADRPVMPTERTSTASIGSNRSTSAPSLSAYKNGMPSNGSLARALSHRVQGTRSQNLNLLDLSKRSSLNIGPRDPLRQEPQQQFAPYDDYQPERSQSNDMFSLTPSPGRKVEEDSHRPQMEGWLHKQGDRYKIWNKRWFLLKDSDLFYFKGPRESKLKGHINLRGYKILPDPSIHSGKYCFKAVHDRERNFIFYTDTEESLRAWLHALMKATIMRNLDSPVISSSNIETVSLELAQKMKPRPPSLIMDPKEPDLNNFKPFNNHYPADMSSRAAKTGSYHSDHRTSVHSDYSAFQPQSYHDSLRSSNVSLGQQSPTQPQFEPSSMRIGGLKRVTEEFIEENEANQSSALDRFKQSLLPSKQPVLGASSKASDSPASQRPKDYVDWVNANLPPEASRINDLSNLKNGEMLIRLLESLSGKEVRRPPALQTATYPGGVSATGSNHSMIMLDLVVAAFKFMGRQGVQVDGRFTIKDVFSGNEARIMDMLDAIRSWADSLKTKERETDEVLGSTSVDRNAQSTPKFLSDPYTRAEADLRDLVTDPSPQAMSSRTSDPISALGGSEDLERYSSSKDLVRTKLGLAKSMTSISSYSVSSGHDFKEIKTQDLKRLCSVAHDWSKEDIGPIKSGNKYFVDKHGRKLLLRGVNLCGSSKLPTKPNGSTHLIEGFWDHRHVSFVGRPFPLEEADEHFSRLRSWGLTFVRLLVPWESLEHEGIGIYDEEYIEYLIQLIEMMPKYGIKCFIDPHQDAWSRFSGGSGAPGWTFEVVGLDIKHFKETGAAYVHQTNHVDGEFQPMLWPTNYIKLASATMFTVFWAGSTFCPKALFEGESVQEVLQRSFINCFSHLMSRLRHLEAIMGIEVMNEPHPGYIGLANIKAWDSTKNLLFGDAPSPLQSIAAGAGIPQEIDIYTRSWPLPTRKTATRILNSEGVKAWLPGHECVWQVAGVWRPVQSKATGKTTVICDNPKYFSMHPVTEQPMEFYRDFYMPFVDRFAKAIEKVDEDMFVFVEPLPNEPAPIYANSPKSAVFAPHWYDLNCLFYKKFTGKVTHDVHALQKTRNPITATYFGLAGAKKNYTGQIRNIKESGISNIGSRPCVVGEVGIPMDLNKRKAFITGDYTQHSAFLDAVMTALEQNLVNFTLWNYNPHNDNHYGDHWNGEDFSIFSPRRMLPSSDPFDETAKGKSTSNPQAKEVSTQASPSSAPAIRASPVSSDSSSQAAEMQREAAAVFDLGEQEFEEDADVDPDHLLHIGGRVLDAVLRPYAAKVAGEPISCKFDLKSLRYTFSFQNASLTSNDADIPTSSAAGITEFYIPTYHYRGQTLDVKVTDGDWRYVRRNQTLYYRHSNLSRGFIHTIVIDVADMPKHPHKVHKQDAQIAENGRKPHCTIM
ncbi:hypothetical protein BZG36_02328 [Bifiguratus adelaidae]|uniref:PH domain-containing protein n=1 Tax=Bifiguratus adelaidae TaxID=1938954 RepID=A0A261Y2J3_9FUNG|nr:hypothetical protein BZG36_02328 [Bifiguratus adelaidae]